MYGCQFFSPDVEQSSYQFIHMKIVIHTALFSISKQNILVNRMIGTATSTSEHHGTGDSEGFSLEMMRT